MKKIIKAFLLLFTSISISFGQTLVPPTYSPDGSINSIISKGDTLIVGGDFKHVGKYTGGGALLSPDSDSPILSFPKINGRIFSSSSDGNGGFYVYGDYYRESEDPSSRHYRIEHILADNTFEADFSLSVNLNHIQNIFYFNGILYIGASSNLIVDEQPIGPLSGINVITKTFVNWLPAVTRNSGQFLSVDKIFAKGNSLFILGDFELVAGIAREDAASIVIGTGLVRAWNPRPNWVEFNNYSDLVFYNDKIIIGGAFNDGESFGTRKLNCAIVDTLSGQSFDYLFTSGGLFGNNGDYLYWAAWVKCLQIKDNTLFVFSNGTFDTRVTAINLGTVNLNNPNIPYASGYSWMKYFNMIADAKDMVVVGNSLFITGSNFEKVYLTNQVNNEEFLERKIIGVVKLDITTGNLQNWFPDPVDQIFNYIWTMSASNSKILIGGQFTHLNGIKRNGVYMYNTSNETVLAFNPNFYYDTPIYSMKLSGENLYLGGDISWQALDDYSILGFNVNTGNILNWYPPRMGDIDQISTIEVSDQLVFIGGRNLQEPTGGQDRVNLFAIDKTTGALNSWAPNPNYEVRTLNISHDQLFVGGGFFSISGQTRNHVASYNIPNLTLTDWNPNTSSSVHSIHPKGGNVWLGGDFSSVAGTTSFRIAGVDPLTGSKNISYNNIISGISLSNISSKGCILFAGGEYRADLTSTCNNLFQFDLSTNAFVPTSSFCLKFGNNSGYSITRSSTIIGNDLFFAGSFTKVNNDTKSTNIGRIRFPANYFDNCNISNCDNEVKLTSSIDDYNAGTYIQKSNLEISATNKVLGNSKVTLKSNSSILLLPNTETNSGFIVKPNTTGSFKAEISPCN